MDKAGQTTNDKMTRLEESSLQELEKPLEETIKQAATTHNQAISQLEQEKQQAQMPRLSSN